MQLPNPNSSSQVYLDHADHFEGAAEAWADAELITPAQSKAVSEARSLVAAPAAKLREAVTASDTTARAATKARAHYNVRDAVLVESFFSKRDRTSAKEDKAEAASGDSAPAAPGASPGS